MTDDDALPLTIGQLRRFTLAADDVLMAVVPASTDAHTVQSIAAGLRQVFPHPARVMVASDGIDFTVLEREDALRPRRSLIQRRAPLVG